LRGFDEDVRTHIATALEERGIILHSGHTIKSITKTDNVCSVTLDNGEIIECAQIMAATGRVPNVSHLGLEHVGVAQQKNGAIIVDEHSASSVESIYAVGDVTDRINLTPVAIAEGHAFADSMFGQNIRTISHDNVASAVFSQPPIASVGLSEQAAAQKYGALDIYESQFRAMKNTLSGRAEKTYMKLVVEAGTQIVRGVHMMGPDSAEIMQGMAIAVKMGAKKADFDAVIGIHPTAAEEFVTMRTKRNS
ncbi:MAG: FAD-dependent oxidoreductase, partial [Candidatus Puniceispirillaceae bacterium]